jgi:hypothetical protein
MQTNLGRGPVWIIIFTSEPRPPSVELSKGFGDEVGGGTTHLVIDVTGYFQDP